ncbi:sugar MFS transporter [Pseudoxanthomonas sp. CAU 1598]|uniref:Sugar MFS transporter n=2 Tax=Pseudomarimonas arenosa TaxID=2774145 RepID=A0AAW3ZLH0_9GAMM|nr:sugar MFS transporter [Pseudomarimonas arenosa]
MAQGADQSNVRSLVIVTILFFMWGMLTSLNDILIPHLKSVYTLSYVQAMLVQFCFFGAYFVVSVPAGGLVKRIGYQSGAVTGLLIAASGCGMFYFAATSGYAVFLLAFFVLAAGITILQVAANPFVTLLGNPSTASSRLTLTQAFNSLGTTVGPLFGGLLILGGTAVVTHEQLQLMTEAERLTHRAAEAAAVQGPYLLLAGTLLILALLFAFARLPKVEHAAESALTAPTGSIFAHRNLLLGAIAIFLYVGGEVSIGSFLVNFIEEPHIGAMPAAQAATYVSYYWGLAMVGRFIGFAVMRYASPGKILAFNASGAIALILLTVLSEGKVAMWAILFVGLFNSIMFPTIFSMAVHGLGVRTGQGSGVLCMAIVGGAIVPFAQGALADRFGVQMSFYLPIVCYAFILYFGYTYRRLFLKDPAT